jgi:hypothetical protein
VRYRRTLERVLVFRPSLKTPIYVSLVRQLRGLEIVMLKFWAVMQDCADSATEHTVAELMTKHSNINLIKVGFFFECSVLPPSVQFPFVELAT